MSNQDRIIARAKRCQCQMLRAQLSNGMRKFRDAQRALDRQRRRHHLGKTLRALRAILKETAPYHA